VTTWPDPACRPLDTRGPGDGSSSRPTVTRQSSPSRSCCLGSGTASIADATSGWPLCAGAARDRRRIGRETIAVDDAG